MKPKSKKWRSIEVVQTIIGNKPVESKVVYDRFSKAERKRLLKQGLKRISHLATGKIKGQSEAQFRRRLRKRRG